MVSAQTRTGWTEPQFISSIDEHGSSPTLAADSRGVVHAFWSARPVDTEDAPWAIAYARLENGVWSQPEDIFLSPNGGDALFPRALVDDGGRLHLVWSAPGQGPFGPLYHSWAPVADAGSIQAWQPPVELAEGTYQSDLRQAPDGTLHLVYASVLDGNGICHRASADGGESWSEPTCIERSYPLRDQENEVRPRLAIDSQNVLHVVWMLDDYSSLSKLAYSGRAVYYAQSVNGGQSWSSPLAMDIVDGRDASFPEGQLQWGPEWGNIVIDAQDRIHVVFVGAPDMQRYHTFSEDGGRTWSPREVAIPSGGYNSWQGLVADVSGNVYLIWPSLKGLEYTTWRDDVWSPVLAVADQQTVGAAHHAQAVIALGNQLHVVWQDYGGNPDNSVPGRILYASTLTDAASQQPKPVPTVVLRIEPAATATEVFAMSAAMTPVPNPQPMVVSDKQPRPVTSTGMLLVFSVLPAVLIIAVVLVWRIRSR